ncbi:Cob(I)yrinic acid a,c-diamide adenosyltransferase [Ruminiclostridium hungatei]|uniref:Cob(I)yrinic acid a,c-diamide adenosyltransferase n=1 Tax=Ruminiclostridium hungatei TaxID=48256 RepID=A0A1V4SIN2_RUMHU|nr:cob(I)yrinic acid a,c-diamide adenosyltransferase [Ruminiclostridium hungatei]OPX43101.1 Cob(I)yrinic acid a,c-diamide adenosyltransferase [Ruminiclostridium hungatei]
MNQKGLVHIYTGDGKGKTTAAVGLGIRACGNGMRVLLVQFLKSRNTGELEILKKLEPGFKFMRGFASGKFSWNMTPAELEEAAREAARMFGGVAEIVKSGEYELVILDELIGVVALNFLSVGTVLELIKSKPEGVELVLTGRNAPEVLVEAADYVSEIKAVKHPYERGIASRKGIEY